MACQKCGSAWVTRKGKDMVSCPECCKQQRAKARRLGRLPASQAKVCERCGNQFEAVGGNAIARSTKCRTCVQADLTSRVRQKRYQAKVKAGIKVPGKRAAKSLRRECVWCHTALATPSQKKYCSNKCFVDARNAGQQSWDRRRQLESVWHRGGKWACAPSKKIVAAMESNFTKFVADMNSFRLVHEARSFLYRAFYPDRQDKPCKVCGAEIGVSSRAYCSPDCMRLDRIDIACFRCGEPTKAGPISKRVLCSQCRINAIRLGRKLRKRDRGTHRKRCRKYGGYYNPDVTRRKVFDRDGWICHVCHRKTLRLWSHNHPREATVDHYPVPLSRGGDHDWHNVRCACRKCNSERSNKWDGQRLLALRGCPT